MKLIVNSTEHGLAIAYHVEGEEFGKFVYINHNHISYAGLGPWREGLSAEKIAEVEASLSQTETPDGDTALILCLNEQISFLEGVPGWIKTQGCSSSNVWQYYFYGEFAVKLVESLMN